ncbi:MAG: carbohydrate ABC transporter substrate-binding protein [Clostridia bacterium]|nr:carbohydrate ABC transporter substrate-binding protein [Clostridia bacterium]MBR2663369.1 carbohydrate ABC transporter substrate-binding protein [Clostridia bacterium]MBR6965584.1 carbohydrate ABC transporter substrate-binding protein [Clostridia bacterium]
MKKVLSLVLAAIMVLGIASAAVAEEAAGKPFIIYAWNEEFKGFFEAYVQDALIAEGYAPQFVINPSDNGVYQQKLDEALLGDAQVDMFLAEADYIQKYADSEYTQDITKIGVTDFSNAYEYTVKAASDADGVVKGVSFQCCPSALIYRRSIAKDVLGTDDPAEVQAALDSWEKFEAVAADAKAKGYYMTASFAETYRVFSNNCTSAWVDADKNLVFDAQIEAWIAQTEKFVENGYTLTDGIWGDEKNAQMFAEGKTMCFFGPAWYFNFCMGNAQDPEKGCSGDWAICQGPAAHFWGGTWLMAATKTQNADAVAEVMNAFINNEEICSNLVAKNAQFSNNKAVNAKFAEDPEYGSDFLGGQNDVAVFAGMTDNIKWENHTIYDQLLNEGLQTNLQEYFKGVVTKDEALANFYKYVNETYPEIVTPE